MKKISMILAFSLMLCCYACQNNNPQGRVAIKGDIKLEGKPLLEGSIQFESLPGLQPGVITGGTIQKGTFSIAAADGLIPEQEYIVRIKSMEEIPGSRPVTNDPLARADYRDIVPPQFGKNSTLTFTATKKSPNVFQIDMVPQGIRD